MDGGKAPKCSGWLPCKACAADEWDVRNAKRTMEMNSLFKARPTAPIPSIPTTTEETDVQDLTSSALQKSSCLAGKPRVVYYHVPPKESRKKSIPKKYAVYSVYDRDDADPEWYWVKWNGYRDDAHDTASTEAALKQMDLANSVITSMPTKSGRLKVMKGRSGCSKITANSIR
jgi:hypothetical protein